MMISVYDFDSGLNGVLSYNILRGEVMLKFVIDVDIGLIFINLMLDCEEKDVYFFIVYVSDKVFLFCVVICMVKIIVLDRNDYVLVFNLFWLNLIVMEN